MSLITKYAFRGQCDVEPCTTNPTSMAKVTGPCYYCAAPQEVGVWPDDLQKFRDGGFVQNCFPYLKPAEREFLLSGICNECWTKMCPYDGGDEEDDEHDS